MEQHHAPGGELVAKARIVVLDLLDCVISVNEHHARRRHRPIGIRLHELLGCQRIVAHVGQAEAVEPALYRVRVFPEIIDQ